LKTGYIKIELIVITTVISPPMPANMFRIFL